MNKKEYVFILGSYACDKKCPYCIAKMNKNNTESFEKEFEKLKETLQEYKNKKITFNNFILSGNGETSLYKIEELKKIKDLVEETKIFTDYRIQTSGNLFGDKEKLELFSNWIKEVTVISSNSKEDQDFYKYKIAYLKSKDFIKTERVRVNIVVTNENLLKINKYISDYSKMPNIETIALKILDNSNNNSTESKWVEEHAFKHNKINELLELITEENKFITFKNKRFVFKTKEDKLLTIHYSEKNTYDGINITNSFKWHKKEIKKGIYGELSKVEEELAEAKDALEQNNTLMYLIELSDIVGAVEGIIEKHGLSLEEIITFSDKVKESKQYE